MSMPLTPKEAQQICVLPYFVIDAVNELIIENYRQDEAFIIKHIDFVSRVMEKMPEPKGWDPKYFEIERTFGEHGWHVRYEVTGDGEEIYTFKAKAST